MPTPAHARLLLARRLRELREGAGLIQGELAELLSVEEPASPASVSSWENQRAKRTLPRRRLEPYARLFSAETRPLSLVPEEALDRAHADRRDVLLGELRELWAAARRPPETAPEATSSYPRSWRFDDRGPLTIVAPDAPDEARGVLADPSNPGYTELHNYADLDALIELHGHVRAENAFEFPVFFTRASRVRREHYTQHLVLLGGIGLNPVTAAILGYLQRLPIRQMEVPEADTGEIFAVGHGAAERRFEPRWLPGRTGPEGHRVMSEDVALLARVRNPYNSARTLTLCNGVNSRGVYGAVRTLTDIAFRQSNERYLDRRFGGRDYALLLRVRVVGEDAITPNLQDPGTVLYAWCDGEDVAPEGGQPAR